MTILYNRIPPVVVAAKPTVLEILKGARALITDESKWTTGVYAKAASGKTIDPRANAATCFCAMGAVMRQTTDGKLVDAACCELLAIATDRYGEDDNEEVGIAYVNDHLGLAETLSVFDAAIASLAAKTEKLP